MQRVESEDFAMTEGVTVATTSGDRTTTNPRVFPPKVRSTIEQDANGTMDVMMNTLGKDDENIPPVLHSIISNQFTAYQGSEFALPEGFVSREVFLKNMKCKDASGFSDLVRKAARENNWNDVLNHGMHLAPPMNELIDHFFSKMYFGLTYLSILRPTVRTCFCSLPTEKIDNHVACRSGIYSTPTLINERQVRAPRHGDIPNVTLVT
jgi:hypothetical protein